VWCFVLHICTSFLIKTKYILQPYVTVVLKWDVVVRKNTIITVSLEGGVKIKNFRGTKTNPGRKSAEVKEQDPLIINFTSMFFPLIHL
jgi:hypothetical protein